MKTIVGYREMKAGISMGKITTLMDLIRNNPGEIGRAIDGNLKNRKLMRYVPDRMYLKMRYGLCVHRRLNLKNPAGFNEKLQWLKLYYRDPEYEMLVDKLAVKEYVSEHYPELKVIPTIGVWERPEDIDFDVLPDQFVIKCTHDTGSTIICKDRSRFEAETARTALRQALENNMFYPGREWVYKNVHPRIIAEPFFQDDDSDELKDYTDKLYEGCENDVEKLERIKELLQSFEYTETPGMIPEYVDSESDFLDYFILESRKGYCSYFATACTLLARAEGIPARYVQGYDIKNGSRNSMYVSSNMAHAWCEVYFDGAGWVSYDCTPGFGGGTYWASESKHSDLPPLATYERKETPTDETNFPEVQEEPEDEGFVIKWYMVAIPVAVGIAVIALFFLIFKIYAAVRLNKMDYDRKFVVLCKQIFTVLKLLGKPIKESETIYEYKVRLSADYEEDLLIFTEDLENYLYNPSGNEKGFKEACEKAFKIRDTLLEDLKKRSIVRFIRYHLVN